MTPPSLRAAAAYRNVAIDSRAQQHDQYQLVVMMFETTLECLAAARGAIQQGDVELKIKKIGQAIRIVQEGLRTSLDMDNGGELAANLASLYDYCVLRMTQANASNDEAKLEEVANLIKPVAEAWNQMRSGQNEAAPAPAATTTVDTAPAQPAPAPRRPLAGGYNLAPRMAGNAYA